MWLHCLKGDDLKCISSYPITQHFYIVYYFAAGKRLYKQDWTVFVCWLLIKMYCFSTTYLSQLNEMEHLYNDN